MIAINIASARIIREKSKLGDPILILDDVFSALDVARRATLAELVLQFEQSIVTCAVQSDVPANMATRVVTVNAGTLGQS
jgi:DNA replication and repair protein RecF